MAQVQAEAFAEAIAESISADLVTKSDLTAALDALEGRFDQKLAALQSRFDAMIAALESRILRWMGAGFAATIAILATLIQFAHR
jgi:hypothetical protein